MSPVIPGERIRLRAIERSDLPSFQVWLNDPEVRSGLSHYMPFSQVEEERWYDRMLERPVEEHPLAIEVQQGESWVMIGNCGLFGFDWRTRSAEFGIFIGAKAYWDQGIGAEATALVLKHGFKTLNLNRISLRVVDNNPRAIRTYEKVGFVEEGRLRQAEFKDGAYVDVRLMSVLRTDWQAGSVKFVDRG